MRRDNLHQTLVFLGSVAIDRIPELATLAASLRTSAFKLEFGVTGYWRHNRIVWVAPHTTPEPLLALVAELEQGLRQAGFKFDQRPYAPHLTLIRDARAPARLPALTLAWKVAEFALVRSARIEQGSRYEVIARGRLVS